jgi:hypothetical protein
MNHIKKLFIVFSIIVAAISISCLNPISFDSDALPTLKIIATINPSTEAILVIINDTDDEITAQVEGHIVKISPNSSSTFEKDNEPVRFRAGNILFTINDIHFSAAIFGVSYISFGKNDSISILIDRPIDNEITVNNDITDLKELIDILSIKTGSIYVENKCESSILVYIRDYNNNVIISEEIPKKSFRYVVIPNLDINIKNYEVVAMLFTDGIYLTSGPVNVGIRDDSSSALPIDYKEQRIEYISFIEEDFEYPDEPPPVNSEMYEIKMVMFSFINGIHYWVASSNETNNIWKDIKVNDVLAPSGIFISEEPLEERQKVADAAIYTCGTSMTQTYEDGFYKWKVNSIDENSWIKISALDDKVICLITIE